MRFFGAHQPLGHRGLRHREGLRDGGCLDAQHDLQHQRGTDVGRDGGVRAHQHQLEAPVGNLRHVPKITEFGWAVVGFAERLGHPVGA